MKQSYRLYKTKPGLMAKPPHRSVGDLSADPRDWGQADDYLFSYLGPARRGPESADSTGRELAVGCEVEQNTSRNKRKCNTQRGVHSVAHT